jgi:MOSC domain-containing protein YiiM
MTPTVVAIHLSSGSRRPLASVERVNALVEQGLEGDVHLGRARGRRTVLVVEQEVLDRFGLKPGDVREQITVRGLPLVPLVFGSRLRIGNATFEVGGLCAPCERMNELKPGLRAALGDQRGRFVRVVEAGAFAAGDPIAVMPPVPSPAA